MQPLRMSTVSLLVLSITNLQMLLLIPRSFWTRANSFQTLSAYKQSNIIFTLTVHTVKHIHSDSAHSLTACIIWLHTNSLCTLAPVCILSRRAQFFFFGTLSTVMALSKFFFGNFLDPLKDQYGNNNERCITIWHDSEQLFFMTYVFLLSLTPKIAAAFKYLWRSFFEILLVYYKGVPNEVVACTKPGVKKIKILSLQQRAQALSTDAEETLPDS